MEMQYGKVDRIDKPVSRIVQGSMVFPLDDLDASFALLDAIFALGCNTIDLAHIYGGGKCERVVGEWMELRGNRDEVVVLTKGAHHNQDRNRVTDFDIKSDLYDSLARLKTDHIDLYLLHRDDPAVPVGSIVEALNEHADAGRIHAFGGSNWTVERLREANEYAEAHGLIPFAASSPNFSLADQVEEPWPGCLSLSGRQGDSDRAWYEGNRLPVFTWSSLAQGFFSGRLTRENFSQMEADEALTASCIHAYCHPQNFDRLDRAFELARDKGVTVPQIALAYVLSHPLDSFTLIGCASGDEMAANIEALALDLTPEELAWLDLRTDTR